MIPWYVVRERRTLTKSLFYGELSRSRDDLETEFFHTGVQMKTTRILNVYRRDFQLYMLLMLKRTSIKIVHKEMRNALAVTLRITEVLSILQALILTFARLKTPECSQSEMGYVRLMQKLFPDASRFFEQDAEIRHADIVNVWRQFLMFTHQQEKNLHPSSHEDLMQDLVSWMIKNHRSSIMPIWTPEAIALIEFKIRLLSPKQQDIIRRRFGIGRTVQTLREIEQDLLISKERNRQIEHDALAILAMPSGNLRQLVQPIGNLLQQQLEDQDNLCIQSHEAVAENTIAQTLIENPVEQIDRVKQPVEVCVIPMSVLLEPVRELYSDARLRNIFGNHINGKFPHAYHAPVLFLGDLIQCSETHFRKQKNCGANSFEKIQQKLLERNLHFDTLLDPETKRAFEEERAQLLNRPSL